MESYSWWQITLMIITVAFSVVAIKIAISFDINKFQERKDKKLEQKIKNTCTHMSMVFEGDEAGKPLYAFQSHFISPPGTPKWQCQKCGLVTHGNDDYEKRAEYYAKNPDIYNSKNKKFQKLLKKGGVV